MIGTYTYVTEEGDEHTFVLQHIIRINYTKYDDSTYVCSSYSSGYFNGRKIYDDLIKLLNQPEGDTTLCPR